MNPDVNDLFVESVEDGKYLASDGKWTGVNTQVETIKVRFGSDI